MKDKTLELLNLGCKIAHLIDPEWIILIDEPEYVSVTTSIGKKYEIHVDTVNVLDTITHCVYFYSNNVKDNIAIKNSGRFPQFKVRYYDERDEDFFMYSDNLDDESLPKMIAMIIRYIFNSTIMSTESGFYIGNDEMTNAFTNHKSFKCIYSRSNGNITFKDAVTNIPFWRTTKVLEYERYDNMFWFFRTKNTKYMLVPAEE